jgi:hypothetical protein
VPTEPEFVAPPAAASTEVPVPAEAPAPAPEPLRPNDSGPVDRPEGHWSTQAELDDREQIIETTLSRSVHGGSSHHTTNALVLPTTDPSVMGPISGTGEVFLTGTISLPDSFGQTGAHPEQLDQSDIDHVLDPGDSQVHHTDSVPVRASSAVSTHTSPAGMIAPQKPHSNRMFTILIVAAGSMAVLVGALLVVVFVTGQL